MRFRYNLKLTQIPTLKVPNEGETLIKELGVYLATHLL